MIKMLISKKKQKWSTLVMLLLPTIFLQAQDFRAYGDGPLLYQDFQGYTLDIDSLGGEIYFEYEESLLQVEIQGVSFEVPQYAIGINQQESWIVLDGRAEMMLDYFQVLFDMQHLRVQKINHASIHQPLRMDNTELNDIENESKILIDKFLLESSNGSRNDIVKKWLARLENMISEYGVEEDIPIQSFDTHGGVVSIGANHQVYSGSLLDQLGNSTGISMELGYKHHQSYLFGSMLLGFGRPNNGFVDRPFWDRDISINRGLFLVGAGQYIQWKDVQLLPTISLAINDMYINRDDYEGLFEELRSTKVSIGAGMHLEFPIFKKYNFDNFNYLQPPYHEHGIRIGVNYATPVTHFDQYRGHQMHIQLGYYYHFGDIRVR